jgi:hypothetical protein
LTLPYGLTHTFLSERHLPIAAAQWIATHQPPGALLNDFSDGAFLMWVLGPRYPVFIDERFDLYLRTDVVPDYEVVCRVLPGWEKVLSRNAIKLVVLKHSVPLVRQLSKTPGWTRRFQANGVVVLTRN